MRINSFSGYGQWHLTAIECKALTDFVARASGTEEAFIQKEFRRDKPGEAWLTAYFGLKFTEPQSLAFALASRERDMRLVRTRLGDEPTKPGGCGNTFLKRKQFRREPDTGKENPGAIEAAQPLKPNRNGWQMQLAQSCDRAIELFRAGIAQELQSNVPRFGNRPAQPVPVGLKPHGDRTEFVDYYNRQRYPNKQAHTTIMVFAWEPDQAEETFPRCVWGDRRLRIAPRSLRCDFFAGNGRDEISLGAGRSQ